VLGTPVNTFEQRATVIALLARFHFNVHCTYLPHGLSWLLTIRHERAVESAGCSA
jgi:hypothetical protein